MSAESYLTVKKICNRNTRNRFILFAIFVLLFFAFSGLSLMRHGTGSYYFSIEYDYIQRMGYFERISDSGFITPFLIDFAKIFRIIFIYLFITAIAGAINYKYSTTYLQLRNFIKETNKAEEEINAELAKYEIESAPRHPKQRVLDKWAVQKRMLRSRFFANYSENHNFVSQTKKFFL